MDDLGGDNLRGSNKAAISGWWLFSEKQTNDYQNLFYLSNDYTGQQIPNDGSIGVSEISLYRREVSFWWKKDGTNIFSSFAYSIEQTNYINVNTFNSNVMGKWAFGLFSISFDTSIIKGKISSELLPQLPIFSISIISSRSYFSQIPNLALWLYSTPQHCKINGYIKDIFFHIGYDFDSEPNSYENMKRGDLFSLAKYSLITFDEIDGVDNALVQIIKDSSGNQNHAIRGTNSLDDQNDPSITLNLDSQWELRFFSGQFLRIPQFKFTEQFMIKFGFTSNWHSSIAVISSMWEEQLKSTATSGTITPLQVKIIYQSNFEKVQVCLRSYCFTSTDQQAAGSKYYVYITLRDYVTFNQTEVLIQVNDNPSQSQIVLQSINQQKFQSILIGDPALNTTENSYYRLFDIEMFTGSYFQAKTEVSLPNCKVQLGKNTFTQSCAQCNNGFFKNENGQCVQTQSECLKIGNAYPVVGEQICQSSCPALQTIGSACQEDYYVDKQMMQSGSITYSGAAGSWTQNIQISFQQTMKIIPQIYLTLDYLDDSANNYYNFKHEATAITTQGFILKVTHNSQITVTSHKVSWLAIAVTDQFEAGKLQITNDPTLSQSTLLPQAKSFTIIFNKIKLFAPKILISVVGFETSDSTKVIQFSVEVLSQNSKQFEMKITPYALAPIKFIDINWIAVPDFIKTYSQYYDFDVLDFNLFFSLGAQAGQDRYVNNTFSRSILIRSEDYIVIGGITRIRKLSTQGAMKIKLNYGYNSEFSQIRVSLKQEQTSTISAFGYNVAVLFQRCNQTACRDFVPNKLIQIGIDKSTSQTTTPHLLDSANTIIPINYTTPKIIFTNKFPKTPQIFLAIQRIEINNSAKQGAKFLAKVNSPSNRGFSINYSKWGFQIINAIWASWLATNDEDYEYGEFSVYNVQNDTRITISFNKKRSLVPQIIYSIVGLDTEDTVGIQVQTYSINSTHCIAGIYVNASASQGGTSGSVKTVWVQWLSVPLVKQDQMQIISKTYFSNEDFSSQSGQYNNTNRWDNSSFSSLPFLNYSDIHRFWSLSNIKMNSNQWKMDFSNIQLDYINSKAALQLHMIQGYTESIGFNYLTVGLSCSIQNCTKCEASNPKVCQICQGSMRMPPDCKCPKGYYEDPVSLQCTLIPIHQCIEYDPFAKQCLQCVNSTSQQVSLNCSCQQTSKFNIFQQQTNQAFDWEFKVSNAFSFNLTFCDKCISNYSQDGTLINIKQFYNPVLAIDTRYNYFSVEQFNSSSILSFTTLQKFTRTIFTSTGLIPEQSINLLNSTQINYEASMKAACIYNNLLYTENPSFAYNHRSNDYSGQPGDKLNFTITPNSLRAVLLNERQTSTIFYTNYFTLNENIQTYLSREEGDGHSNSVQAQCQELRYFPLAYAKLLKNSDNSRQFIGTATIQSVDTSPVFKFEQLGGEQHLKRANTITISSWLYLRSAEAYYTTKCITPYLLATNNDLLNVKEYLIACGYYYEKWWLAHKYPQYLSEILLTSDYLQWSHFSDKWMWLTQSLEINELGLGGVYSINIYCTFADYWVFTTNPLNKAVYSFDNPSLALYVNSYSQFPGMGTAHTTQAWSGLIYDLTWYVGISCRTLKRSTIVQMMKSSTEPILYFDYLDQASLYNNYLREKAGYLLEATAPYGVSSFIFNVKPLIDQNYFSYIPKIFNYDYSIGYSLFINFKSAFEFMTFQRIDSQENTNVFSIYHFYDSVYQVFRTKVCCRFLCQSSTQTSILHNKWQNVFISLQYKPGQLKNNEPYFISPFEQDIVLIFSSVGHGQEEFSFNHYQPAATGQADNIVILNKNNAFPTNNTVLLKDFKLDHGSFSMNKYENFYQIIPHCLFFSGKQTVFCRQCDSGFTLHQGKCVAQDNSLQGCGGVSASSFSSSSQFLKLPQNYYYNMSLDACIPCSQECEICNLTSAAFPNNCAFCQAPWINPPQCNQVCGVQNGRQTYYLRLYDLQNYSCVVTCPENYCKDIDRKICRKCRKEDGSFGVYYQNIDEYQFFTDSQVATFWTIKDRSASASSGDISTSICSTSFLENQIVSIIGGKDIFTTNTVISRYFSHLPPHFQVKISVNAFFIDVGVDASIVIGDLVIQLDQTYMLPSNNYDKSLGNNELCGDTTLKDMLRSYTFSAKHDYPEFNLTIGSQISNWGVRNIEVYLSLCHITCLTCTGQEPYECSRCPCGLTLVGGECTCSEGQSYFAKQVEDCYQDINTNGTSCFQCVSCDQSCLTCFGPSNQDCLQCNTGYSRMTTNGTCLLLQQCPLDQVYDSYLQGCFSSNLTVIQDLFDNPLNKSQLQSYTTEYGSQVLDIINCAGTEFMGIFTSYPRILQRNLVIKQPHCNCTLQLAFLKVDSWDNEAFKIDIDGVTVLSTNYGYSAGQQICLLSYYDQIVQINISFLHSQSSLMLQMYNNQDGNPYYQGQDEGWAIKNVSLVCSQCHYTCKTCNLSQSRYNCTSCYSTKFNLSSTGQCICVDGYYLSYTKECTDSSQPCSDCLPCNPSCATCQGSGPYACTQCKSGLVRDPASMLCKPCPTQQFQKKGLCYPCHSSCLTCFGSKYNHCKSCPSQLYLFKRQCVQDCPEFYTKDLETRRCLYIYKLLAGMFFITNDLQESIKEIQSIVSFYPQPQTNQPANLICNSMCALGGEHVIGNNLQFNVTVSSIAPHDIIAVGFTLYQYGTWVNSQDMLLIALNNQSIVFNSSKDGSDSISLSDQQPASCSAQQFDVDFNFSDSKISYSSIVLTFSLSSSKPVNQISYAIRNLTTYLFKCHPFCLTCFDITANSCLTCSLYASVNQSTHSCQCKPNFFLQVIFPCIIKPCSQCVRCSQPCKACFDLNDFSCTSCDCNNYYLPSQSQGQGGTCIKQCPLYAFIQNQQSFSCQACESPCNYCQNTTNNCTSCVMGYMLESLSSTCHISCNSSGFYPDLRAQQCKPCDISCQGCAGPGNLNCLQCNAAAGYYNHSNPNKTFQCLQCDARCITCSGPLNSQCSSCMVSNITYATQFNTNGSIILDNSTCTTDCREFYHTYIDFLNQGCSQCHQICVSCFGPTENQCLECVDRYYLSLLNNRECMVCNLACILCTGPSQDQCFACASGYFYKPPSTCAKCPRSCLACTSQYNCTSCITNRQGALCDCRMPFGIDYFQRDQSDPKSTAWCGTCTVAIVAAQFSDDWQTITIKFDFEIQFADSPSSNQTKPLYENCVYIFSEPFLSHLGDVGSSLCSLSQLGKDKIIIQLDGTALIQPGQEIVINQNTLKRFHCISFNDLNITQLISNTLRAGDNPQTIKVALNGPLPNVPTCVQSQINITEISNDGKRGPLNLTWILISMIPYDNAHQIIIDNLLSQASSQMYQNLTFPPLYLNEATNYQFKLIIFSKFNLSSFAYYTISTFYSEYIQLKVTPQEKIICPTYSNVTILIYFKHLQCTSATDYIEFNDTIQYQWKQIEGNTSLGIDSSSLQVTQPNQTAISINIQPFTAKPLENYVINFTAVLNNKPVSQFLLIQLNITQSALQVSIVGGSRIASFSESTFIQGSAQDIDLPPSSADPYQDMIFSWMCLDLSTYSPCKNITDQIVPIPPPSNQNINITFPRKTFLPYKSYKFTLTAQKGARSNKSEVIIMFQEFNLPQLSLDVPTSLLTRRVNLNDEVFIKIQYSSLYNPDTLFYSGTMFYDYNAVAVMIFEYVEVRFRIWDYFTSFQDIQNDLIIRFSVYNPLFMMPSQMSLFLKVNLPPQSCQLSISPQLNASSQFYSVQTDLQISVILCNDSDQPLKYKFFLYSSYVDYLTEIKNKFLPLRNILSDYQENNTLLTKLAQGVQQNQMQLTVMASIIDSEGGITNITQNITVLPNQFITQNNQASYYSSLNQFFQESELTTADDLANKMRIYTILSLELKSQPYDSSQFIQLKKLVLDSVFVLKQNLSSNPSPWDDQIAKIIDLLMTNSSSLISSFSLSEISMKLDNLSSMIELSSTQLSNIPLQNRGYQQTLEANKIDAFFMSSAGAISGMLKAMNSTAQNNNGTQSNYLNQQIINITGLIALNLAINSLPNESPKFFKGDALQIKSQIITAKNLQSYLRYDNNDWTKTMSENDIRQQDNQNETTQSPALMYIAAFKHFLINPYSTDSAFPESNSSVFPAIDPGLYYVNSTSTQSKIQISTPIKHLFRVPAIISNASTQSNQSRILQNQSTNATNTTNGNDSSTMSELITCIQFARKGKWDAESCSKLEDTLPDGNRTIKCICKNLDVTTIQQEMVQIFKSNKNIQLIISEKGLELIQEMEWWNYIIFYMIAFFTIGWIYLIYYGYNKDKIFQIMKNCSDNNLISRNWQQQKRLRQIERRPKYRSSTQIQQDSISRMHQELTERPIRHKILRKRHQPTDQKVIIENLVVKAQKEQSQNQELDDSKDEKKKNKIQEQIKLDSNGCTPSVEDNEKQLQLEKLKKRKKSNTQLYLKTNELRIPSSQFKKLKNFQDVEDNGFHQNVGQQQICISEVGSNSNDSNDNNDLDKAEVASVQINSNKKTKKLKRKNQPISINKENSVAFLGDNKDQINQHNKESASKLQQTDYQIQIRKASVKHQTQNVTPSMQQQESDLKVVQLLGITPQQKSQQTITVPSPTKGNQHQLDSFSDKLSINIKVNQSNQEIIHQQKLEVVSNKSHIEKDSIHEFNQLSYYSLYNQEKYNELQSSSQKTINLPVNILSLQSQDKSNSPQSKLNNDLNFTTHNKEYYLQKQQASNQSISIQIAQNNSRSEHKLKPAEGEDAKQPKKSKLRRQNAIITVRKIKFKVGLFSYHEFLSIFNENDQTLSRPVRFSLYYLKVTFLLATTAVFSDMYDFIQTILLSSSLGLIFSAIIAILKQLLKRTQFIFKFLGYLFVMCFLVMFWYASLVIAASMGINNSNIWAIQFASTFVFDNFCLQILKGLSCIQIIVKLLLNNTLKSYIEDM